MGQQKDFDDIDDEGNAEERPGRSHRRSSRSGGLGDYLAFRKMIVPIVIQVIFWVLSGLVVLGGVGFLIYNLSQKNGSPAAGFAVLFVGVPFYVFLIRMYCELLIVIFRMNDTLTDIKNAVEAQRR